MTRQVSEVDKAGNWGLTRQVSEVYKAGNWG